MEILFPLIGIATYIGVPATLLGGWRQWARSPRETEVYSRLSLLGFLLGTSSALFAVGSIVYAQVRGGFPFHDPLLLSIYRWGFLISIAALLFAAAGIWRKSVLRWYAPALSIGMLLLWLVWAISE